jgi:hypothetical protein
MILRMARIVVACAIVVGAASGCSLVEPPYGIAPPPEPGGAVAVVSPAGGASQAIFEGRVLWRLEGTHPAMLHQSGQADATKAWETQPGLDPWPAFLSYGPYWQLPLKRMVRVKFRLSASSDRAETAPDDERVAVLDVHDPATGILAAREVISGDFPRSGGTRDFTLEFENDPAKLKRLEFRVAWWGKVGVRHQWTEVLAGPESPQKPGSRLIARARAPH